MKTGGAAPEGIDGYIAGFSPEVQSILQRVRQTIRTVAPGATETISYRMPTFVQNGVVLHFAAFKNHIGLYPPISGDPALEEAISPYAGPKGNLQFPLDQPIPYDLIERMAKHKLQQNLAKPKRKKGGG